MRPASADLRLACACSTAASCDAIWRPIRSMVACWVAIRARRVHRDLVVAVVDPEDHVAGMHQRIVARQDRGDMARDARTEHGVVGADIGIIGGDEEAANQRVIARRSAAGERQQRDHADEDEALLAGLCRSSRRNTRRRRWRRRLVHRGRLAGPAPAFFGGTGAQLIGQRGRCLGTNSRRRPGRARNGRCARPGLSLRPQRPPHYKLTRYARRRSRPIPYRLVPKVSLTERFGQGIVNNINWPVTLSGTFPVLNSFARP